MKDNELDDLFRHNADYLADEPPRDFDKDAFWQQLQTELPKKADHRKKLAAWWWAAASVLLAGMLGGIWWMQSGGVEKKLANKVEVKTSPEQIAEDSVPRMAITILHKKDNRSPISERGNPDKKLLAKNEKVTLHSPLPAIEEIKVQLIEMTTTEKPLLLENETNFPEVIAPAISKKQVYRVVHINEIRQRKQQEAKARSRVAFQIGIPVPPEPEPYEGEFSLSISIPH